MSRQDAASFESVVLLANCVKYFEKKDTSINEYNSLFCQAIFVKLSSARRRSCACSRMNSQQYALAKRSSTRTGKFTKPRLFLFYEQVLFFFF